MSKVIEDTLQKGQSFRHLLSRLASLSDAGKPLQFQVEARSVPYLDHQVVSWVDGPPSSVVAFVFSGEEPGHAQWRRFTLSKVGPWRYELECFPTPFGNAVDPLSPGMPPSQSRAH